MIIRRQWVVPAKKDKVWETLTDFNRLAELAFFTEDFVTSRKDIEKGTSFSETHYFLGKRHYTGTFTKFIEPHIWELESDPKEGTGFPVYHKVSYVMTEVLEGTKVTCVANYETNWKLGKYVDYLLFPVVCLFVLDIHRKMRIECSK